MKRARFVRVVAGLIIFQTCPGLLLAADSYVANGGDNANPGSMVQPWATVAYALGRAGSGDTVFLQRGSVFREGGLALTSGERLASYGDPAEPLPALAGSLVASNFTPWASNTNVQRAAIAPGTPIQQVYVDGARATLARYPDAAWLRTDPGTTDDLVFDAALTNHPGAAPGRWVGAQVRWRKWSWWYETRPITNDNGLGALALGGTTAIPGDIGINSGFYIDNTLLELDAPGEWYWDSAGGWLYLYPPAGAAATAMVVECAWQTQGLALAGCTLERVAVRHYTDDGLKVTSSSTVRGCLVEHCGDTGITGIWGASGTRIEYCRIRDILNDGILWNENFAGAGGTVMEYNQLERIGTVPGLGGSGPTHAIGIYISNGQEGDHGVRVRYNRVHGSGYAGILLGADRQRAERNVLSGCMATLNDGGAIYCYGQTNYIVENIVLNTEGDLDSSQPWTPLGHGIWTEFLYNLRDSEIIANTVFGSGGNGLFLPNNIHCKVYTNVFFANRLAGIALGYGEDEFGGNRTNEEHDIQGNLLGIGPRPWQTTNYQNLASWAMTNDHGLLFQVYTNFDVNYGVMRGTTFLTTNGQDLVWNSLRQVFTIGAWQATEPAWADPAPTNIQGAGFLFINDTESAVDFPLPTNVTWQSLQGAAVSNTVGIDPFRSVVLLAASPPPASLPACFLATDYGIINFTNWMAWTAIAGTNLLPAADPDQDGLPNFAEYYYNLDPDVPDARPGIACRYDPAADALVIGHQRRAHLDSATGVLQRSWNLAAWSNLAGVAETATPLPDDLVMRFVETTIPLGTNTSFFIRLKVME